MLDVEVGCYEGPFVGAAALGLESPSGKQSSKAAAKSETTNPHPGPQHGSTHVAAVASHMPFCNRRSSAGGGGVEPLEPFGAGGGNAGGAAEAAGGSGSDQGGRCNMSKTIDATHNASTGHRASPPLSSTGCSKPRKVAASVPEAAGELELSKVVSRSNRRPASFGLASSRASARSSSTAATPPPLDPSPDCSKHLACFSNKSSATASSPRASASADLTSGCRKPMARSRRSKLPGVPARSALLSRTTTSAPSRPLEPSPEGARPSPMTSALASSVESSWKLSSCGERPEPFCGTAGSGSAAPLTRKMQWPSPSSSASHEARPAPVTRPGSGLVEFKFHQRSATSRTANQWSLY
mmetsp:Transcript_95464/g.307745  ORF Transcript_95464/g.307745 Transcript_95464/m.307745 type:complete len:354 (+) Transcript_95464:149-1210(+)